MTLLSAMAAAAARPQMTTGRFGRLSIRLRRFCGGGSRVRIVEEHAAAVFAGHDGVAGFGVGAVVAEVVPALRAHHHLAGGALLVQGFGDGGAFGVGDAVVVGEEIRRCSSGRYRRGGRGA